MKKVSLLSQWQRQLDNTKSNHIVLTQFSLSFSRFLACHNSQAFSTLFMWHLLFSFSRHCRRFRCHLFVHYMDKKKIVGEMQRIFKFLMLWFLFWFACPFWILQANVTRFLQAMMTQIFQKQCQQQQLEKQKEIIGAEWRDTSCVYTMLYI